jgi:hypothetical protein
MLTLNQILKSNSLKEKCLIKKYNIKKIYKFDKNTPIEKIQNIINNCSDVGDQVVLVCVNNSLLEHQFGSYSFILFYKDNFMTTTFNTNIKQTFRAFDEIMSRGATLPDCTICFNPILHSTRCRQCNQPICITCCLNLDRCPFCRNTDWGDKVKYVSVLNP